MNRHRPDLAGLLIRLTYANVVATLALIIAVGTGGAYAVDRLSKGSVNSRAIKNGAIKPKDMSFKARGARANVTVEGRLEGGTASRANLAPPNQYTVTFGRSIARCSVAATANGFIDSPDNATATVVGQGSNGGRVVDVRTYDGAGNAAPSAFSVVVDC